MQLSHRDVALSNFARHRREIDKLISGNELEVTATGCNVGGRGADGRAVGGMEADGRAVGGNTGGREILRFSNDYKGKIAAMKEKGYEPRKSTVRHIVYWQGKDMDKEIKIVLPDVEFGKMG